MLYSGCLRDVSGWNDLEVVCVFVRPSVCDPVCSCCGCDAVSLTCSQLSHLTCVNPYSTSIAVNHSCQSRQHTASLGRWQLVETHQCALGVVICYIAQSWLLPHDSRIFYVVHFCATCIFVQFWVAGMTCECAHLTKMYALFNSHELSA